MKDDRTKPPVAKPLSAPLSAEDHELWAFVTRSIQPLLRPAAPADAVPKHKKTVQKQSVDTNPADHWLDGVTIAAPGLRAPAPGAGAAESDAGIDRRTAEKLRKGKMPIDAILDLHGLRQGEAQDQLTRFILGQYQSGRRCLLVITGKGNRFPADGVDSGGLSGVLRRMVPVWFGQAPLADKILLHSPAQPKDGGSGALYVLLRRRRPFF